MSGTLSRIQDSIHGLMEFHDTETAVVEVMRAKELQRMRRIRQLGLAHLVFPGAEHSRLVHSLGAAFVAVLFSRRLASAARDFLIHLLSPGPESARDLALAALCHDVGHGPLSHLWEREVIGERYDFGAWCKALHLNPDPKLDGLKWHELVGQALLAWEDGDLHGLLEQRESGSSARIRQLLLGRHYLSYLPRLLSSDIDVDRCDFILRDTHQTGVAYGRFDIHWLISTATLGRSEDGSLVVGFDSRKSLRVVEQFLIARRALYETVFYHKTVRCAEGMVGLFLRRIRQVAKDGTWPWGDFPLFAPIRKCMEGTPLAPHEVVALDDHVIWFFIQHVAAQRGADLTSADLAARIVSRDLFKIVPCSDHDLSRFLDRPTAHDEIVQCIRRSAPGDPAFYYYPDKYSFRTLSDKAREKAFLVNMDDAKRPAAPIRDHPELRYLWQEARDTRRLFVVREAVDDVVRLVRQS